MVVRERANVGVETGAGECRKVEVGREGQMEASEEKCGERLGTHGKNEV